MVCAVRPEGSRSSRGRSVLPGVSGSLRDEHLHLRRDGYPCECASRTCGGDARRGGRLLNEEIARLVRVSAEDEVRAWLIFSRYGDKGFSYSDYTLFALMERLQLDSAFSFDAHFAQYGRFALLPGA